MGQPPRSLTLVAAALATALAGCPDEQPDAVFDTAALADVQGDASDADAVVSDTSAPDVADAATVVDSSVATDTAGPAPLPERVIFRTPTESFNQRYFVALRAGQIWVKPNSDAAPGATGGWDLLGATGRPEGSDLPRFGDPAPIVAISADGVHLTALSADGVFYRGDDLTNSFLVEGTFNWTDRWGWPAADGPGLAAEWELTAPWSVSDSHPLGVAAYQDLDGTTHSVGGGVAHVYRLGPDGHRLHFNDWWLPADWSREICPPDRGRWPLVALSASASTLFVARADGALFTRLYDFDTAGENPLYTYSYVIDGPSGTTRKLPAEPWRRQPDPPGRVSARVTIFQDGQGNAARVLRVAGADGDGRRGWFEKRLDDPAWVFHEGGLPGGDPPLLDGALPAERAPEDRALSGTLSRDGVSVGVEALDFNVVCSPARLRLSYQGQLMTVGGAPAEVTLHHVHTLVEEVRATRYWEQGAPAKVRMALLPPHGEIDDPAARQALATLLDSRPVINLLGEATADDVDVEEIPWTMAFRVPGDEKAFWSRARLRLSAE